MDRRSLITGVLAAALSSTALRAKGVKLPELSVTAPSELNMPSPHVADRRYLKDLWQNLRAYKVARRYSTSNAEVRHVVSEYIDAMGKQLPLTFTGYDKNVQGGEALIEVTFVRFRENKNPVGCKDLYIDLVIPDTTGKGGSKTVQHLLNIECLRA